MQDKRVFIVAEDDPAIIDFLRLSLEKEKCQVEVVQDGLTAIERLQVNLPDLVILDLRLPKLEGLDVLWEVRHNLRLKSIPVIIISYNGSLQSMLQGWQLGVDSYFIKPFDPDELLRVARRILSLQSNLEAPVNSQK